MNEKRNPPFGKWIPGFLCCAVLLSVAGCKTATAKEKEPTVAPAEPAGETPPTVENAEPEPQSEAVTPTKTAGDGGMEVPAPAKERGPGDGPPPREYVNNKVEAMEESLAPLNAVPAVPAK